MNKHLKTLEFDKLLKLISEHALSESAKNMILNLTPASDIESATLLMQNTTDAKYLISKFSNPPLGNISDPTLSVQRANMSGVLSPKELLEIASLLKTSRLLKKYCDEDTSLSDIFARISSNKYLEELIYSSILNEEEISDSASSELASIRRKITNTNTKIRSILAKFTSSKFLQENIVTMRSGRFVVPVKAEHKGDVAGLVHDVSSSGATVFIEPSSVVAANNELRELEALQQQEIHRILLEISAQVSTFGESIIYDFHEIITLDFIFAKAKFSFSLNCADVSINDKGQTVLVRARHPLIDPKICVPIDISLGVDFDTLVITGPNTGGKTVSIKIIGLLTLMACSGLHIPANEQSTIAFTKNIYADIGDEQSIEQSLSTFSSHMKNIVEILKICSYGDLILFDELGAGTDPTEGAGLAIAILEYARNARAYICATTHYSEIKMYALTTPGIENASLEFDVATLKPTYKVITGIPGKSNAFSISKKLGLSDDIINRAKEMISSEQTKFEDVIIALEAERDVARKKFTEAENLKRIAQSEKDKMRKIKDMAESEQDKIIRLASDEAEKILRQARMAASEIFDEINAIKKQDIKSLKANTLAQARASIQGTLKNNSISKKQKKVLSPDEIELLKVGDDVEIINIGVNGTILSITNDTALVQAGILKTNVKINELRLLKSTKQQKQKEFIRKSTEPIMRSTSSELDIRGNNIDESLIELDQFISDCLMSNIDTITVIHGKGTGVLRKGIQAHLKTHKFIKSFRDGKYGEGENGVTIATFR